MKIFKRSVITVLVIANLAVLALYWQLRTIETQLDTTAVTNQEVVVHLDTAVTQPGCSSFTSMPCSLLLPNFQAEIVEENFDRRQLQFALAAVEETVQAGLVEPRVLGNLIHG